MAQWRSNSKPLFIDDNLTRLISNHYSYFTDKDGQYITSKQIADPGYDPYIMFSDASEYYLYHPKSEEFFIKIDDQYWPYSRVDINDKLIEAVFKHMPKIYSNDFVFPKIQRTWPRVMKYDLISTQQMTDLNNSLNEVY